MKNRLLLLCALLPLAVGAQEIAGRWEGKLFFGGQTVPVAFRVVEDGGAYRATLDLPEQGVKGVPVDSVVVRKPQVGFYLSALDAVYIGVLGVRDVLMGTFTQRGVDLMLTLARRDEEPLRRPQEPVPPFPYRSEEGSFRSRDGSVELHGTLTLPCDREPLAAVVLVTGSGTQNRDEEIMGHKPFLVLADYLTRRGIAVLRYDDRGFGWPKEELARIAASTTADLTLDALGAFDLLRTREGIDPQRIGIAGHSEGGTIAFLAAAQEPGVAFVVSLAGMTVPGSRTNLEQNRLALKTQGIPEPIAADACALLEECYELLRTLSPEELKERRGELAAQLAASGPGAALPEPLRESILQILDVAEQSPWMYYFLTLDPASAVATTAGRPVFALNGSKDTQVDARANLEVVRRLLPASERVLVREYEGLNHLFQHCTTGSIGEYEEIEETMSEEVLADIAAWIEKVAR